MEVVSVREPKYVEIAGLLRKRVWTLEPGALLDSEADLCSEFGVSRGTIRMSLDLLSGEGLLRRIHGIGTEVLATLPRVHFTLTDFEDQMRRSGRETSATIISVQEEKPSSLVSVRHKLETGQKVFRVERIVAVDNIPAVHEVRVIGSHLCPGLLDEDLTRVSIHSLLVYKYKLPMIRLEHVIERSIVPDAICADLECELGSPAYVVERLSFTTVSHGELVPAVHFSAVYLSHIYDLHLQPELENSRIS